MKNFLRVTFAAVCLLSCGRQAVPGTDGESQRTPLSSGKIEFKPVICGMEVSCEGTKSILGDDIESVRSGYQLIVLNRDTGTLEGVFQYDGGAGSEESVELNAACAYDFFLIGNLWFLDASGDRKSWNDLFEQTGTFPSVAADMKDPAKMPYYRLDGGNVPGTSLRTQTFAECVRYGIPYAGMAENVSEPDLDEQGRFNIVAKRLFAKETVIIDHSGLDGGISGDYFRNGTLCLRQVNCRMHPFIENVRAAGTEDILASSDYYSVMDNGNNASFVLYLPENMQGTGGGSATAKTPDNAPSGRGSLVTYIELKGTLDKTAGGYGGNLMYRFCLGGNNSTDYNVKRNTSYEVSLGFDAGSVFNPYWKVTCTDDGGLSDSRRLGLCRDADGGGMLAADNQVIAVRKGDTDGRSCYVYYNKDNALGDNQYTSHIDAWVPGYSPANVTRAAIKVDLPSIPGVKCDFDAATGKLSFVVNSPGSFVPGGVYDVRISLCSTGSRVSRTYTAKVKTCEDMSVGADFSNYYVGQKRMLSAKGFCGERIELKAVSGGNDILRLTNTEGSGGYITSSPVLLSESSVPVYAYKNGSVTLSVTSDDDFNDGSTVVNVTVAKPEPVYELPEFRAMRLTGLFETFKGFLLPIDGTKVRFSAYYRNARGIRMSIGTGPDDFDKDVYSQILAFVYSSREEMKDWIGYDDSDNTYYIKKLYDSSGRFFSYNSSVLAPAMILDIGVKLVDKVEIRPKNTDIFTGPGVRALLVTQLPGMKSDFSGDYIYDVMNTYGWPEIELTAEFESGGCSTEPIEYGADGRPGSDYYSIDSGYEDGDFTSVKIEDGRLVYKWSISESNYRRITDEISPPYGKRSIRLKYTNMWSGETWQALGCSFKIKHKVANVKMFPVYHRGADVANIYFCTELSRFIFDVFHSKGTPLAAPPKPYDIIGSFSFQQILQDNPLIPIRTTSSFSGTEVYSSYTMWQRNGGTGSVEAFASRMFDDDLINYSYTFKPGYPGGVRFYYGGTDYGDMPALGYSGGDEERAVAVECIPMTVGPIGLLSDVPGHVMEKTVVDY